MISRHSVVDRVYIALGVLFFALGTLTFLNVAAGWHEAGILLSKALGFALLDTIAAYGFFLRARWLLPGFVLNTVGIVALSALHILPHTAQIVALVGTGAITVFLYYTRNSAKQTPWWLGVSFFILWTLLFVFAHYPQA